MLEEIKELEEQLKITEADRDSYYDEMKSQEKEIHELKEENADLKKSIDDFSYESERLIDDLKRNI